MYDILVAIFCILIFVLINTIYKCVKKYKTLRKTNKFMYNSLIESNHYANQYYHTADYYYKVATYYGKLYVECENKLKTSIKAVSEDDNTEKPETISVESVIGG